MGKNRTINLRTGGRNVMKKVIFFDIDGTISSEETGYIPESAVCAIRQARKNGHLVFINTGRTMFSIDEKYKEIGFDGYICGCGTDIYVGDQCIFRSDQPEGRCREIMEMARQTKVTAVYESHEAVFFDHTLPKHEVIDGLVKRFGLGGRNVPEVIDGDEIPFEKFCFWVSGEADLEAFLEYIAPYFQYVDRGNDMYELMPKGISKGTGIQVILDYYQIPLENSYAIGDSTNDLAMLEYVPHSIAMGNSMKEILPFCEYQTDTVENDGIEKALRHYGII